MALILSKKYEEIATPAEDKNVIRKNLENHQSYREAFGTSVNPKSLAWLGKMGPADQKVARLVENLAYKDIYDYIIRNSIDAGRGANDIFDHAVIKQEWAKIKGTRRYTAG